MRGRRGRGTAGQHGDIAATDPVGKPFVDAFTVEIKRGYAAATVQDLVDRQEGAGIAPWGDFIAQAIESHGQADSMAWMLIVRRDRREALVVLPWHALQGLREAGGFAVRPFPLVHFVGKARGRVGGEHTVNVAVFPLRLFFAGVSQSNVLGYLKGVCEDD